MAYAGPTWTHSTSYNKELTKYVNNPEQKVYPRWLRKKKKLIASPNGQHENDKCHCWPSLSVLLLLQAGLVYRDVIFSSDRNCSIIRARSVPLSSLIWVITLFHTSSITAQFCLSFVHTSATWKAVYFSLNSLSTVLQCILR